MTNQTHTHIIAEDANGQRFEQVESSPIKAQTARCLIPMNGGTLLYSQYCTKNIAECSR